LGTHRGTDLQYVDETKPPHISDGNT
jgi:hypothetical protein